MDKDAAEQIRWGLEELGGGLKSLALAVAFGAFCIAVAMGAR